MLDLMRFFSGLKHEKGSKLSSLKARPHLHVKFNLRSRQRYAGMFDCH